MPALTAIRNVLYNHENVRSCIKQPPPSPPLDASRSDGAGRPAASPRVALRFDRNQSRFTRDAREKIFIALGSRDRYRRAKPADEQLAATDEDRRQHSRDEKGAAAWNGSVHVRGAE